VMIGSKNRQFITKSVVELLVSHLLATPTAHLGHL